MTVSLALGTSLGDGGEMHTFRIWQYIAKSDWTDNCQSLVLCFEHF